MPIKTKTRGTVPAPGEIFREESYSGRPGMFQLYRMTEEGPKPYGKPYTPKGYKPGEKTFDRYFLQPETGKIYQSGRYTPFVPTAETLTDIPAYNMADVSAFFEEAEWYQMRGLPYPGRQRYTKSQLRGAGGVTPTPGTGTYIEDLAKSYEGVEAPTGFGPSSYTGSSIVDYLKSIGQPSDFASRTKLATQYGITNYTGTAEQNTRLLSILRGETTPTGAPGAPQQAKIYTTEEATRMIMAGEKMRYTPDVGWQKVSDLEGIAPGVPGGVKIYTSEEATRMIMEGIKMRYTPNVGWQKVSDLEAAGGKAPSAVSGGVSKTYEQLAKEIKIGQTQGQIQQVKSQIADLQAQQAALKKYGLTDTSQLRRTETGEYVPTGELPPEEPPPTVETSAQARATLREELEEGLEKPTPYESLVEFDRLRTEQGIVDDENELNAIRNEANLARQELRQLRPEMAEGVPMAGYTGRMSEAERNLNFRLEGLAIRETAVINRLNSKNAYISTVVTLGLQDYQMAYQQYTDTFNQNLQIYQLVSKEADQTKQDAQAALSTMTNLLSAQGVSFSELSPEIQTQISSLELQAGLPAGFTSTVFAEAEQYILTTIVSDDKSTATILYENGTTKTIPTGITGVTTYKAPTVKNFGTAKNPIWKQWNSITGQWGDVTAPVTPTEPKPAPMSAVPGTLSPQGQWRIDESGEQWEPVSKAISVGAGVFPMDEETTVIWRGVYNQTNKMLDAWDTISQLVKGPGKGTIAGFFGAGNWDPDVAALDTVQGLVGMQLTRLYEKGTLTDEDRLFYLSKFPDLNDSADVVESKITTLKQLIEDRLETEAGIIKVGNQWISSITGEVIGEIIGISEEYNVGDIVEDVEGIRWRYIGNNQWEEI
jgi:hypothetical protein